MTANALVTGGGRGIGKSIANSLIQSGYDVYIITPSLDHIDRDCMVLKENTILVDFEYPERIEGAFEQLGERVGKLDLLVNNSGVFPRQSISEIDVKSWTKVMNVNLASYFFCTKSAYSLMKHSGTKYIINISSDAIFLGPKKGAHYSASKAAIVGLTRSCANSFASDNILVNCIVAGVTDTSQSNLTKRRRREKEQETPLGAVAKPKDIADVVLSLVSGKMDHMTGQKLVVNGGRTFA